MASGSSNYNHGEMDIKAQSGTFGGFMGLTKYGGTAVALIVLLPVLIFGVNMAWFPALVATIVIGILIGVALKLKGVYYVSLIGSSIFVAIICAGLSMLAG